MQVTPLVSTVWCLVGVVVLLLIAFVASALKIVPEYQRLVVFRLGRCIGARGPGLVLLIPFVDRAVRVDLRELVREIPAQTSITLDNAPISIDFLWYYKVFDPVESVLQVGNFEMAAQGIATTTLRSVIGGIMLDDVLSQREKINQSLRTRLDEVTERWGVKVTNVEIREIIPPREVQDSMNRQLTAERTRRAVVTESTGAREAAVNVAEGERQAAVLRAEGDKQAQLLRAEGYAAALERIFSAANAIDQKTMTLQYFETLKAMSANPATKYIFPLEFTSLISRFVKGQEDLEEKGK
ncbi:MAG: SPFH/Band 7/PHB domain protein [Chloroflexi bacterium]|nr:SPFH/Band 7/PHB domain protein [Chloroflexota bacterium]